MGKKAFHTPYEEWGTKPTETMAWTVRRLPNWPGELTVQKTPPLKCDSQAPFPENRSYKPRSVLFRQGEPVQDICWICSGLVKLSHIDAGGREVIIGLRGSGSLLGLATAILHRPHATSAETLTPCALRMIPVQELITRLHTDPVLAAYVHEFNAREIAANIEKLIDIATRAARYNLLKLLSQIVRESDPSKNGKRHLVQIPMRQWELAGLLGVTPEHLNRVLRSLERQGIVIRRRTSLLVTDVQWLLSHSTGEANSFHLAQFRHNRIVGRYGALSSLYYPLWNMWARTEAQSKRRRDSFDR